MPLGKFLGIEESPAIAAAKLRSNPSLSAARQQAEESAFADTDAFGNFDPTNIQAMNAGNEAAAVDDPWSNHYDAMSDIQSGGLQFNAPEQEDMRNDALMRALAPIHARGQYDLEEQRIASGGQLEAAQAKAQQAAQAREGQMARTQATQQGQGMRQRNSLLESQAKDAEKRSRGPLEWLMGKPSGADQAAELRGQQQFVESNNSLDLADQIRAAYPGQSFQELIAAGMVDVSEASPEEIAALLAAE